MTSKAKSKSSWEENMALMRDFANYAIARYCGTKAATAEPITSIPPPSSSSNVTTATAEVVPKTPATLRRKTYKGESSNNPTSSTINYYGIIPIETGYQAQIVHDSKTFFLGSYVLPSDAACIYDMALERLGMNVKEAVNNNFRSFDEYRAARAREVEAVGRKVDLEEVISYGRDRVDEMMEAMTPSSENATAVARGTKRKSDTDADCNDEDGGDDNAAVPEAVSSGNPRTKTDAATSTSGNTPRKSNSLHSKHQLCKIVHKKQHFILGSYRLNAVAAWAYDKASKLLQIGDCDSTEGKVNFRSQSEYHAARKLGMKEVTSRVAENETKVMRREKSDDLRLHVKTMKPKKTKTSKLSYDARRRFLSLPFAVDFANKPFCENCFQEVAHYSNAYIHQQKVKDGNQFKRISGNQWLTADDILNWMKYLHFFNSNTTRSSLKNLFFHYDFYERLEKRETAKLPLFHDGQYSMLSDNAFIAFDELNWNFVKTIFMVVSVKCGRSGRHWIAVIYDVMKRIVHVLDSSRKQHSKGGTYCFRPLCPDDSSEVSNFKIEHDKVALIPEIITHMTNQKYPAKDYSDDFKRSLQWRIMIHQDIPHQINGHDCGAFVCYFFGCYNFDKRIAQRDIRHIDMMNWRTNLAICITAMFDEDGAKEGAKQGEND